MKYSVIIGGQEYGPADIATLKSWIAEGRITKDTELKDELGSVVKANTVFPELNQPKESPAAAPGPANVGSIGAPATGYAAYPRGGSYDTGEEEWKKALIFLILGFLCCPVIFEVLAVVYANQAKAKGNQGAQTILIIAWILLGLQAVGIILYILLAVGLVAAGFGASHQPFVPTHALMMFRF